MQTVTQGRLLAALNFALAIGLDLIFRLFSWLYGTPALHPREELLLATPSWFGVSFALLGLVLYYEDLIDEPPTVRITPNASLIVSAMFLAVGSVLMVGAVAMILLFVKP